MGSKRLLLHPYEELETRRVCLECKELILIPQPTHIAICDVFHVSIKHNDVVSVYPISLISTGMHECTISGYHVWFKEGIYDNRCFLHDDVLEACFKPLTPTDLLGLKFDI